MYAKNSSSNPPTCSKAVLGYAEAAAQALITKRGMVALFVEGWL
jgi:hypothetical protein